MTGSYAAAAQALVQNTMGTGDTVPIFEPGWLPEQAILGTGPSLSKFLRDAKGPFGAAVRNVRFRPKADISVGRRRTVILGGQSLITFLNSVSR